MRSSRSKALRNKPAGLPHVLEIMQPWSAYAIVAYVITTLAADVETCQRSLD